MRSTASGNPPTQWSTCSVENLGKLANVPCIDSPPDPDIFWDNDVCGDGFITGEEECDCGGNTNLDISNFCNPDCCNAHTCKLKDHATENFENFDMK